MFIQKSYTSTLGPFVYRRNRQCMGRDELGRFSGKDVSLASCANKCIREDLCVAFQWKQKQGINPVDESAGLEAVCELSASCTEELTNPGDDYLLFLKTRSVLWDGRLMKGWDIMQHHDCKEPRYSLNSKAPYKGALFLEFSLLLFV